MLDFTLFFIRQLLVTGSLCFFVMFFAAGYVCAGKEAGSALSIFELPFKELLKLEIEVSAVSKVKC